MSEGNERLDLAQLLSEMSVDELRELLEEEGLSAEDHQMVALAKLVREAGGLEEAGELLQLMSERRAA